MNAKYIGDDANTKKAIVRLLEALEIPRNGVLLIHSSFKGLSRAGFRAETVLKVLTNYLEPGTLLMPSMSWRSVNLESPFFDELSTPSITGVLSEVFRTQFATHRSLHPTHSVSGRGNLADSILSTHFLDDTPCSERSPWGLLDDNDAYIMLLGVEMDSCTLVHHVEETMAPNLYLHPTEMRQRYLCRDRHDREIEVYTRRHLRLNRNFWQFEDRLAESGKVGRQLIEDVWVRAFNAKDMVDVITKHLQAFPDGTMARPGERSKLM